MSRRRGFTLLELLIVIIIIVIMSTLAVALMSTFFRGQGVRQGAMIVSQVCAQAKQGASKEHRTYFVVFSNIGTDGWMEIHRDSNNDGIYGGDRNPKTNDATDPAIDGGLVDLPRLVAFDRAPQWVGFSPSGYLSFPGGSGEVQTSAFDRDMNAGTKNGEIILRVMNRGYFMCIDLDRPSGKIRRSFFVNEEQ